MSATPLTTSSALGLLSMPVSKGVLEKEVEDRLFDLFIIGCILLKEPEKLFLGGTGIFFDDLPQQVKGCALGVRFHFPLRVSLRHHVSTSRSCSPGLGLGFHLNRANPLLLLEAGHGRSL
jgi:hypothetical protein